MRVEAAHRYDVPVERGFAFITDTSNWPRFWPGYRVRLARGIRRAFCRTFAALEQPFAEQQPA